MTQGAQLKCSVTTLKWDGWEVGERFKAGGEENIRIPMADSC